MFSFLFARKRPAKRAAEFPNEVPLTLSDGSERTARLHRSARARKARMSLHPGGDLVLTVPNFLAPEAVLELLPHFLPRLEKALHKLPAQHRPELPQAIILPAVDKKFSLELCPDRTKGLRYAAQVTQCAQHIRSTLARPLSLAEGTRRLLLLEDTDCLRLFGAVEDTALCARALRQWCLGHARAVLPPFLRALAESLPEYGPLLAEVHVRDQRSRWGSCSYVRSTAREQPAIKAGNRAEIRAAMHSKITSGIYATEHSEMHAPMHTRAGINTIAARPGRIQINWRALLLPVPVLEHLCWHELCHLRQMNHSPEYYAALDRLSPERTHMEKALNRAWRELPWWALPA